MAYPGRRHFPRRVAVCLRDRFHSISEIIEIVFRAGAGRHRPLSPALEPLHGMPFRIECPRIIDRDTRRPEIFALSAGAYAEVNPSRDGWLSSAATGIELREADNSKLSIRIADNDATRRELP